MNQCSIFSLPFFGGVFGHIGELSNSLRKKKEQADCKDSKCDSICNKCKVELAFQHVALSWVIHNLMMSVRKLLSSHTNMIPEHANPKYGIQDNRSSMNIIALTLVLGPPCCSR